MSSIMEDQVNSSSQDDNLRIKQLKYRKWALIPVLFCFVFGGGMSIYIVPEYIQKTIKESYHINTTVNNESCSNNVSQKDINDIVQQKSAEWNLYTTLAAYIPAIFTNLVLGAYSDLIGRKVLLAVSLTGISVKIAVVAIIIKFKLDFIYFIFGNLIEGFTGAFTLLIAVSFSYISDLTTAGNQRTLFIVLLELIFYLSITLSSITVGYFIKETGFFYPSVAGSAISFLGVLIAISALPETLARTTSSTRCSNTNNTRGCSVLSRTFSNIWNLFFGQNRRITTVKYIILLSAFMFTCIPKFGNFETLYQLGSPFCWSPTKIGWYGAVNTCLSATFGLFSAYIFKKCLQNETIAAIGIVSMTSGLIVEAFATTSDVLYLVPVIGFLGSLPIPMIRSLMSHMTSSDQQGALFASIGAIETICVLLGAVTSNVVYAATLKIMNGFVFLVSAFYAIIALALLGSFMVIKRCVTDDHVLLHEVLIDEDSDDIHANLNGPD